MAIDKQMHGIVTCLNTMLDESDSRQRVIRYENFVSETSSGVDDALTSIEEWAEGVLNAHGYSRDYQEVVRLIGKERQYSILWYAMNCIIRAHDVRTSIRHGDAASAATLSLELMGAVWQANERRLKEEVMRRRKRREEKLLEDEHDEKMPLNAQNDHSESREPAPDSRPDLNESVRGNQTVEGAIADKPEVHAENSGNIHSDHQPVRVKASPGVPAVLNSSAQPQKDVLGLTSAAIKEKVHSLLQIVKPVQEVSVDETPDIEVDFTDTIMEVMETGTFENTEETRKYYQQVINQVKAEHPKYDLDAVRQLAANRLDVSKQYLINLGIRPN